MEDQSGSSPAWTNSSINHGLVENLTHLFSSSLSSEWTRVRLPYNFQRAFVEAKASTPDKSARIFLETGGFKAWVAYFLITKGEVHFNGRQARQELLNKLNSLSVAERARIAQMVAASSSHPTTEEPIRSMEEQCLRTQAVVADTARSKRRRQDEPPRRYDGDSPLSPPDSTLRTINNSRGDLPHTDRMHTYADSCLPEELGQLVTGASIQELESVFPEYISGAIRRDHSVDGDRMTAAITMNFPPRSIGDVACIMTLVVEPNKVERLAMLLFGAHLESDGGSREVVLQGGTRVRPHPQFLLQGSPSKAISEVFGLETAAAIAAAPYRKQEILMGTWATRCVTMTIYVEAHEPALINLNLGLKQGFKIHDKLYTSGEI